MEKGKNKGSVDKLGIVDLARADLLRKCGLKITPALREYYRYTGISAEVEKHGVGHDDDSRCEIPLGSESNEQHTS
jgi:hypothetical protein